MKLGIFVETKEYEKAWNGFRFAVTAKRQGHEVKVFLMGEGVECPTLTHEKFNVAEQVDAFSKEGGEILACGTCMRSRNIGGTEVCPISNMNALIEMVEWADKTLTI